MNDEPPREPELRALASATTTRIQVLLDYYLRNGLLFNALSALSILDGVKAPITLTELATQYTRSVRTSAMVPGQITLHELILRYSATLAKERAVSARGYRELASLVSRFLGEELSAEEVTKNDVEGVLERYSAGASRRSILIKFKSVLRWGVREHLIANRIGDELPKPREIYKMPAFFHPDRVERIMRTAEEHPGEPKAAVGMVLTLGFFAGIRTAEIMRAVWSDVQEDEKMVRIPQPKGFTRGVRARVVELEPCAVAWIKRWKAWTVENGLPLEGKIVGSEPAFSTWKRIYLKPKGDSWGNDNRHNVMRHTYATMHVGAFRDLKATALNLGHMTDVATLLSHYRGLVSTPIAKSFWEIRPRPEGSYKVFPEPVHVAGIRTFPKGYVPHLGRFESKAAEMRAKRKRKAVWEPSPRPVEVAPETAAGLGLGRREGGVAGQDAPVGVGDGLRNDAPVVLLEQLGPAGVAEVERGGGGVAEGGDVHRGVGVAHDVVGGVVAPGVSGGGEPAGLPESEAAGVEDDGAGGATAGGDEPVAPAAHPRDGAGLQLDETGLVAAREALRTRDAQQGAVEVDVLPAGARDLGGADAGEEPERELHPDGAGERSGMGLGRAEDALDTVGEEMGGLPPVDPPRGEASERAALDESRLDGPVEGEAQPPENRIE